MNDLFKQRDSVCTEIEMNEERVEMKKLIEIYNENIKNQIVKFYENNITDIERMFEVCNELKTCSDRQKLISLKDEYEKFEHKCSNYFDKLQLYDREHGSGRQNFPKWSRTVTQEWFDYWGYPMSFDCSSNGNWMKRGDVYRELKNKHELPLGLDNDYKSEDIWISLTKTILNCHRWRERYNLLHLDAIILHVK